MSIYLAMYKAKGNWVNAIIRWRTQSIYSHCELVIDSISHSSSVRDGGVRRKSILFKDSDWDIIHLPWASEKYALEHFERTRHRPYGWLDLLLTQVLGRSSSDHCGDFCSEWVAAALRLPRSTRYSPQMLAEVCEWRNKT
jgi:hypothetical protein